jgi:hypothetical protein
MWRKANLQRWIAAVRSHPKMGLAGFAVGLFYAAITTHLYRLATPRAGGASHIFALLNASPIITAVLGIAVFFWLSGTMRLPRNRGMVFVICIFPGALVELLFSGIIGTIARTIA